MKKISELQETLVRQEPYRDEYGNIRFDAIEFVAKRRVRTTGTGLRFLHFIVDIVVFQFVMEALQFILKLMNIDIENIFINFVGLLLFIPLVFSYSFMYVLFEYQFQKTPGKFITKSIVIDEYGNKPDFRTILMRNFIRIIPFDYFSYAFGGNWHDSWSRTYVIPETELIDLKKLLIETED